MAEPDSVSLLRRDVVDHARILTEHSHQLIAVDKAEALRQQAEEYLDERLSRIEASLRAIYALGKWVLGAIGSVLVVAVVTFVLKGGPLG